MKRKQRKILNVTVFVLLICGVFTFAIYFVRPSPSPRQKNNSTQKDLSACITIEFSELYKDENYTMLSQEHKDQNDLPESGIYVAEQAISFANGDTAFDLLEYCCEEFDLNLDVQSPNENIYQTAYIQGIGTLYEGDCGKTSGWVYTVNNERILDGMDDYVLEDGDEIVVSFVLEAE